MERAGTLPVRVRQSHLPVLADEGPDERLTFFHEITR